MIREPPGSFFRFGLRAVAELPGLNRRILLYLGSIKLRTEDGIDVLRLGDFLDELESDTLFG